MPTPVCREVSVISLDRNAPPVTGGGDLYTLCVENPGWEGWRPGQFVMVRRENPRADCLWARPFSISDADAKGLRVVFQVAGRETRALAELKSGERVTVWGPLGNAFSVEAAKPTLLLAGGIGLAPFVGYIKNHPAPCNLTLDFGHRMPLECYPFGECSGTECAGVTARSHLETCHADLVAFIGTLERGIQETAARQGLVLACGPMPFLRSVHKFARQYGARAELSLETRMACGIGACLGCVVKGGKSGEDHSAHGAANEFGWIQTCSCGPVFRAEDLDLEESA